MPQYNLKAETSQLLYRMNDFHQRKLVKVPPPLFNPAGSLHWLDGSDFLYSDWGNGVPPEVCSAHLQGNSLFRWKATADCHQELNFVCQYGRYLGFLRPIASEDLAHQWLATLVSLWCNPGTITGGFCIFLRLC